MPPKPAPSRSNPVKVPIPTAMTVTAVISILHAAALGPLMAVYLVWEYQLLEFAPFPRNRFRVGGLALGTLSLIGQFELGWHWLTGHRTARLPNELCVWMSLAAATLAILDVVSVFVGFDAIPRGSPLVILASCWAVIAVLLQNRFRLMLRWRPQDDEPKAVQSCSNEKALGTVAVALLLGILSVVLSFVEQGTGEKEGRSNLAIVEQPELGPISDNSLVEPVPILNPEPVNEIQASDVFDLFEGAWLMHLQEGEASGPIANCFVDRISGEPWLIWRMHGINGEPTEIHVTGFEASTQKFSHYTFGLGMGQILHSADWDPDSRELRCVARDQLGGFSDVTYRMDGEQIAFRRQIGNGTETLERHGFLRRMPTSPAAPLADDRFKPFLGNWSFETRGDFSDGSRIAQRGFALIANLSDSASAVELYFGEEDGALIDARIISRFDEDPMFRMWFDARGEMRFMGGMMTGDNVIEWNDWLETEKAATAVDTIDRNGLFIASFYQPETDGQPELTMTTVHRRIQP